MLQALLAGVASIKAQQTRMNVIGNNLANINTTSYKGSRVTFQDMLAQTIRGAARPTGNLGGTNPIQFGLGVLVAGTDVNNEQGSLNATNRPTDMAIQGNGYFMVSDGQRIAYTRDGAFDLDANGDLVHRATGERVLGWNFIAQQSEETSTVITPASVLNIPLGRLNASRVTSEINFQGNLDGAAPNLPAGDPGNWTTTIRVFDSLGGSHMITMEFFDRDDETPGSGNGQAISSWDWRVLDSQGNPLPDSVTGGSGRRLFFDNNGQMTSTSIAAVRQVTVEVPIGSGGPLNFNVTLDLNAVRQLKAVSQVNASNQNGFPPGELQAFSVGPDGIITGLFTNGLTQPLGQMATSIFPNPGGLERLGSNLWRNTDNSGVPVVGMPRTGGRGNVNSGFLEQSNVDIGNEFTDLIVTQRGFQANTRVVTTVDEMLQDLINMKR
jgi:flagellar hook protein FlgE